MIIRTKKHRSLQMIEKTSQARLWYSIYCVLWNFGKATENAALSSYHEKLRIVWSPLTILNNWYTSIRIRIIYYILYIIYNIFRNYNQ